jgi:hypothetical protein
VIRHWLGVASRDHVRRGVDGGFCQLGHGKEAPIRRLSTGDRIAYYSPRATTAKGDPVQAFTAIGTVRPGKAYRGDMGRGFHPWRRDVAWKVSAHEAPIRPLLDRLTLTANKQNWGLVFRRSLIAVSSDDFRRIAKAMAARPGERTRKRQGGASRNPKEAR